MSAGAGMNLSQSHVGQIAITVSDVAKALHFYRDILGLRFLFEAGPNLAFLQSGDVRIMLSTPQGAGRAGANSILYFHVTGIEAVHRNLLLLGASSERDPDGNIVGLMEEKKSA